MCLEEMLCCTISYGYIFYGETRHRMKVEFTDEVREKVRKIFTEMNNKKSVSGYIDRIIAEEEKE